MPVAAIRAICSSCGDSASHPAGRRPRSASPAARSSRRACSARAACAARRRRRGDVAAARATRRLVQRSAPPLEGAPRDVAGCIEEGARDAGVRGAQRQRGRAERRGAAGAAARGRSVAKLTRDHLAPEERCPAVRAVAPTGGQPARDGEAAKVCSACSRHRMADSRSATSRRRSSGRSERGRRTGPGGRYPSVATRIALIVCRRFSAWSKTMLAGDRKTSSVTSSPSVMPVRSITSRPTVVL